MDCWVIQVSWLVIFSVNLNQQPGDTYSPIREQDKGVKETLRSCILDRIRVKLRFTHGT